VPARATDRPGRADPLTALLWAASAAAWAALAAGRDLHAVLPMVCGGIAGSVMPGIARIDQAARLFGLPAILAGFALMAVAMMAPVLAGPLRQLVRRWSPDSRVRPAALFAFAYLCGWTAAGALLAVAAILIAAFASSALGAAAIALAVGGSWQISPARAACLARCRRPPHLADGRFATVVAPLRAGATLAGWCIAACWPLMLLPLCSGKAHGPVMIVAGLIIAFERRERCRPAARG
jgi:predicted metal-binding membrane protein